MTNYAGVNGLPIFTNLANPTTDNFWRIRSVPQRQPTNSRM